MSGIFASALISAGWTPASAAMARLGGGALLLSVPAVLQLRGRWVLLRREAGRVVIYGLVAIAGGQLCYSACGEPFGGGSGGVGCAAQEAGQELEVRVVVPGADLVDRGVHAGVGQVKAQDFGSAAAGRLDDDAAAVGGVAAALDPAAAFEPVEDAGQGGGVEPVMDPASIAPAIDGADAVLSAVGPRGTGPATVIQDSVHSIIQAMRKTGTRRLLQVSGSVVADDGESPYLRYLLKPLARRTFLRHACAGMRRGEQEIRDSDLDWTIFRPPSLTGKPATGAYRTAIDRNLPHGLTVSRADLAACMLASLSDPATVHRHVAIAS